jgi:ABC-type multidrug transport system ATPase subunit
MYDCLAKNPDLIILDDPISSFDKNKKFAIIERLFRNNKENESFKKKTVLMLTHDIDPIIDMYKVLYSMIEPVPVASFLSNKQGTINELTISKNDLKTFAQVCTENIASCSETINKLIYLRRYFEVLDDKSEAYQLLANLFHKRDIPIQRDEDGNEVEMTEEEISKANSKIKEHIDFFDYSVELSKAKDKSFLKSLYENSQNNYEKLQIYRMTYGETGSVNTVVQKFINETYHIENEYVSQLNPRKYEMIPEFIIEQCTSYINQL